MKNIKDKTFYPYQIIMVGSSLLYIEGTLNLITLSHKNIAIKVKDGVIIITGENLEVKDLTNSTTTIIGKIKSWEKV